MRIRAPLQIQIKPAAELLALGALALSRARRTITAREPAVRYYPDFIIIDPGATLGETFSFLLRRSFDCGSIEGTGECLINACVTWYWVLGVRSFSLAIIVFLRSGVSCSTSLLSGC